MSIRVRHGKLTLCREIEPQSQRMISTARCQCDKTTGSGDTKRRQTMRIACVTVASPCGPTLDLRRLDLDLECEWVLETADGSKGDRSVALCESTAPASIEIEEGNPDSACDKIDLPVNWFLSTTSGTSSSWTSRSSSSSVSSSSSSISSRSSPACHITKR